LRLTIASAACSEKAPLDVVLAALTPEQMQVGRHQFDQRGVVVPPLLQACHRMAVHLVLAEFVEGEHVGDIRKRLCQVGDEVSCSARRSSADLKAP
jgi:hypothetical protein